MDKTIDGILLLPLLGVICLVLYAFIGAPIQEKNEARKQARKEADCVTMCEGLGQRVGSFTETYECSCTEAEND